MIFIHNDVAGDGELGFWTTKIKDFPYVPVSDTFIKIVPGHSL